MSRKYAKSTPEEIADEPDAHKRAQKRWYQKNKGKIERKRKIKIAMNYAVFREADNEWRRNQRKNNPEMVRSKAAKAARNWRANKKVKQQAAVLVNDKIARLKARKVS